MSTGRGPLFGSSYDALETLQVLQPVERFGEWIVDVRLAIELEDPGVEQQDVRLLIGQDPLHLPHQPVRLAFVLGGVELVDERLELGVVETNRIVSAVEEGVVASTPKRLVVGGQSRVPERPAQNEHVEVEFVVGVGRVDRIDDGVEIGGIGVGLEAELL